MYKFLRTCDRTGRGGFPYFGIAGLAKLAAGPMNIHIRRSETSVSEQIHIRVYSTSRTMIFKTPSRPNAREIVLMGASKSSFLQFPAIRQIYLRCLRRRCVFARRKTVQTPCCTNSSLQQINSKMIRPEYDAGSTRECELPVLATPTQHMHTKTCRCGRTAFRAGPAHWT